MNRPITSGARHRCGQVIGEETGGGNLRLTIAHRLSGALIIERADLDDLMVVLDALLGQRES